MDSSNSIEFEIFSTLRKIIKTVDIYSAKLKMEHKINSSQLSCLLVLGELGSISLSQLSKKVSLSPSMITGVIDQLESKELVTRARNSTDRRVILIELTEKGKDTLKNAPLSIQKKLVNALSAIKKEEKIEINKSLLKLLSMMVSEVLIDSSIFGAEDKMVDVEPSVIQSEENLKS
ncbi:MAG: MarR family transcriptional regulator [bacterium]|nr:MarR family transcriptional regulator [bacterium]